MESVLGMLEILFLATVNYYHKMGYFTVVVTLNRKQKRIASGPEIVSRGFVYVRESEELLDESTKLVRKIVEKHVTKKSFEWTNIKQEIRDTLSSYPIPTNEKTSNDYPNYYGILTK